MRTYVKCMPEKMRTERSCKRQRILKTYSRIGKEREQPDAFQADSSLIEDVPVGASPRRP